MTQSDKINYDRAAAAIAFIQANYTKQPSLEQIAKAVHLSPFHFQRIFSEWVGISPKQFVQQLSLNYAKHLIKNEGLSLFDTAYETGLSGTSRLHHLFVNIEAMTPAEYKNEGEKLCINYSYLPSIFGEILCASTPKGLCYMAFEDKCKSAFTRLKTIYGKAQVIEQETKLHQNAVKFLNPKLSTFSPIKLHLRGTVFQHKVWSSLLQIPEGNLKSYGDLAKTIEMPKASRAVGTAIGANPIAYIIPCHRVIQGNGNLGGYMWGIERKNALIAWENAKTK